jgi:CRP-like cAMP-binding protein
MATTTPDQIHATIDGALARNKSLSGILSPEARANLIRNGVLRRFDAGRALCNEHEPGRSLYLILKGEVEISTAVDGNAVQLSRSGPGDLVGEVSMLFLMPRIATVVATTTCIAFEIPSVVFGAIIDTDRFVRNELVRRVTPRIIENALGRIPLFRELDRRSFLELCDLATFQSFHDGETIAHEGAIERRMYVICRGLARVFLTRDGHEATIDIAESGSYFGEYSLFTGLARMASVAAASDLQVVTLEGEAFQSFLDENQDTEDALRLEAWRRKHALDAKRAGIGLEGRAVDRLKELQDVLRDGLA